MPSFLCNGVLVNNPAGVPAQQDLTDILAALPAGLVLLNNEGKVSQTNAAAEELLGKPLLNQLWLDIVKRAFAPQSDDGHEVSLHNGKKVSLQINSLSSGAGQLILLQDLTPTRQLQEQLARHQRLSAMGRMLASLAHQLRTPLATALLYAGHLEKPNLTQEQQHKFASRIKGRLQHMEQQIKDMLIFTKGSSQRAEQIPVADLLNAIEDAVLPLIEKYNLDFTWQIGKSSGKILISKDSLVGAVLNLVNNAAEITQPPPPISLNFELATDLPGLEGAQLLIGVADQGPGIPQNLLAEAQEPFFTTKSQGTGLGLAIVKSVVEAHQGRFWLQSQEGQGTRAWLTLPAEV